MTIRERLEGLPNPSRRKLTLFACSCVREIWHLLEDEGKKAIVAAEKYADGLISKEEIQKAAAVADASSYALTAAANVAYAADPWAADASAAAAADAWAADAWAADAWAAAAWAAAASAAAYAVAAYVAAFNVTSADKEQALAKQHQLFDDIFGS